jgi:hypothetical protein
MFGVEKLFFGDGLLHDLYKLQRESVGRLEVIIKPQSSTFRAIGETNARFSPKSRMNAVLLTAWLLTQRCAVSLYQVLDGCSNFRGKRNSPGARPICPSHCGLLLALTPGLARRLLFRNLMAFQRTGNKKH